MNQTDQVHTYPAVGDEIDGKYRIDGYLGEGGMGAVARAWHTLRKAPVALKFMAPHLAADPSSVERFMNEAVAASQLKSEHIVQVFDVGKLPSGSPYMVLEYLEGRDAAQLVEADGLQGLDVARAGHIVFQVLRGLEIAHAAGIIHRDLKPSNCFLVRHEGDPEFTKILDFGISKVTREGSASITQTNMALGTPLYMSPEQARSARDVDLRCDIYSTGVILYELLCGSAPHMVEGGEFTAVLYRLFTTDAPLITERRPGLPEALVKVVHTALERDPNKRFGSAREFADALLPFCDGRTAIEAARFRAQQTHVVSIDANRIRIQSSPGIETHSSDAVAATQAGISAVSPVLPPITSSKPSSSLEKPEPSAARTDLSSARDAPNPTTASASASPPAPNRARTAMIGAAAAVALLAIYAVAAHGSSKDKTTHDTITVPSTPTTPVVTPTTTPSTTPSVVVIQTPSATATVVPIPSASAKTTATATGTRTRLNNVTAIE